MSFVKFPHLRTLTIQSLALHALVSSLSPDGTSGSRRLGEDDVNALSERLGHILGDGSGSGSGERRNEKGEVRRIEIVWDT